MWPFRFVAVPVCGLPVCGRSGLWPLRFVPVSVCARFGLWPFRFVVVSVCGGFGLWPFRLWPFRFVAVMTCNRIRYPIKTKLKLNSRELSFAYYSFRSSTIILTFAQGTAAKLPCPVQNSKTIVQTIWMVILDQKKMINHFVSICNLFVMKKMPTGLEMLTTSMCLFQFCMELAMTWKTVRLTERYTMEGLFMPILYTLQRPCSWYGILYILIWMRMYRHISMFVTNWAL